MITTAVLLGFPSCKRYKFISRVLIVFITIYVQTRTEASTWRPKFKHSKTPFGQFYSIAVL